MAPTRESAETIKTKTKEKHHIRTFKTLSAKNTSPVKVIHFHDTGLFMPMCNDDAWFGSLVHGLRWPVHLGWIVLVMGPKCLFSVSQVGLWVWNGRSSKNTRHVYW